MKLLTTKHGINGELTIPADKSISHRSIMFGAISQGQTIVNNFLKAEDCLSTIAVFRQLGVTITEKNEKIYIDGKGFSGLTARSQAIWYPNEELVLRQLISMHRRTQVSVQSKKLLILRRLWQDIPDRSNYML